MKKGILFILCLSLVFCVSGCGVFSRAKKIINNAEEVINKVDEAGRITLINEIAAKMADSAARKLTSGEFALPINSDDVTIINIDMLDINAKYFSKSKYINSKSYVLVTNEGTDEIPYYKYYVSYQDEDNYALPLTAYDEITIDKVITDAKSNLIQSICGSSVGEYKTLASIEGIDGSFFGATIYSEQCK